jgi:hydrogenase-1 operon protein HyaF
MAGTPSFALPPTGFGPGSQPTDEEEGLAYLPMPSGMRTFSTHLPEVADPERFAAGFAVLERLAAALAAWQPGSQATIDAGGLDPANRAFVDETLGEGEVSVLVAADEAPIEIQEATFAGVWRLRVAGGTARDRIEVGAFPQAAAARAFPRLPVPDLAPPALPPPGVVNAPALLAEIAHRSGTRRPGDPAHVINLSLLPHTPEDLDLLAARLGTGRTTILSRGYGNCRIDATATPAVWRVRYYNSVDTLILDTIEIVDVPEVACAAPEDLADSAERLAEVLAALR